VKTSVYADSLLTTPKTSFAPGSTAYVTVAGAKPGASNWAVTWLLPSGATACANTAGTDRPESSASGLLPKPGGSFLQFRPNTTAVGSAWNREGNYETRPCPAFAIANEGVWNLRLDLDATDFAVLNAFTVDATPPPTPSIDSGPSGTVASSSASFAFSDSETGLSFLCQLDGGGFGACTSPKSYSSLAEGSHSFQVKARDPAGNDSAVSSRSWTVDTTAPAVTLTQPADGASTTQIPTFSGNAGNASGDSATITVRIYSGSTITGPPVQTLTATRQPDTSYAVSASPPLNGGTYTAVSEQDDAAGNIGLSAPHVFTVAALTPPANTSPPTISGSPQQGQVLTASPGSWGGSQPLSYGYQWQRCTGGYRGAVLADSPLSYWRLGEASGTLAADASGNGRNATYGGGVTLGAAGALTGDLDTAASLDGNDDYLIDNPFPGYPSSAISVEFWMKSSDTTKQSAAFSYATTNDDNELQLRDYRNFTVFRGSTRSLTTGVSANDGAWHQIDLTWRSSDGQLLLYKDGALAYSGTLASGLPMTVGGSVVLGQDQDTVGGGFDPTQAFLGSMDEVSVYPTVLSAARVQAHYQAARSANCSPIAGATGTSYTLTSDDVGATIAVLVTASNGAGSSSASSAQTAQVTGLPTPPTNTALPTISGTAQEGRTLSAAPGSWSGTQPIGYAYQWRRCDSAGANCADIATASASTYNVSSSDVGSTLRVLVTASNSAGSSSVASAQTAVVTSVGPDPIFVGAGDIGGAPSGPAGNDEATAELLDSLVVANPGRVTVFRGRRQRLRLRHDG
jgi:hypothetical protein